jgi:hypothetical protein
MSKSHNNTDYDRIWGANPADRQAAIVANAKGVHWDPKRPAYWPAQCFDAPPRTSRPPEGQLELRGHRYGRLIVIGHLKTVAATGFSLWLVRCACGAHESRTGRAIANNAGPTCWRCDRLLRMQEGRPLEAASMRKRPPPPRDAVATVLSSRAVKRTADPASAMQTALARALQQRLRGSAR